MNRKAIILALTTAAVASAFAWRHNQSTSSPSELGAAAVTTSAHTDKSVQPAESAQTPGVSGSLASATTASTAANPIQPPATAKALPRFLELGSDSCASCKAMVPILAELRSSYSDQLQVEFLDVWEFPDEAEPYAINLIPTQIFFDAAGEELFRHVGFYPMEDIRAKWQELGHPLNARPAQ